MHGTAGRGCGVYLFASTCANAYWCISAACARGWKGKGGAAHVMHGTAGRGWARFQQPVWQGGGEWAARVVHKTAGRG
eukprot:scaffold44620_cov19-Tisochrysis_lutea.AAC.1